MAKVKLKVTKPATGDPVNETAALPLKGRSLYDDTADLRDAINNLVGVGYPDLRLPDAQANYGVVRRVLGDDKAQKLLTRISIHNQRQDLLKSPALERLNAFYEMGSNDKDLGDVIRKVKSFGHGISGDLNTSANVGNRVLAGNTELGQSMNINTIPSELGTAQKPKVMIRVGK